MRRVLSCVGLWLCCATAAMGQGFNLHGEAGLIDLPTAKAHPDGQVSFSYSALGDSNRMGFSFQAMPWLGTTVAYAETPDGPASTRTDTVVGLQFRLAEERGAWPAIALGLRDILGEGVYGAEYIVASKSLGRNLTLTGGLGWGRLGGDGGFSNPFGGDVRADPVLPAGQLQTRTWFSGDAAVFGGLEWRTPVRGLSFAAEYSSDLYEPEAAGGFDRRSPVNLGLRYAFNDHMSVRAAYLHGSTAAVQFTLTGNPNRPLLPQDLGAGPAPVRARPADAPRPTTWADGPQTQDRIVEALNEGLAAEGIVIREARITGTEAALYLNNTRIIREPKAIGRVARILALALPPSVETFRLTPMAGNLPTTTAVIRRSDIEAQADRPEAGPLSWQTTVLEDASPRLGGQGVWTRPIDPRFSWAISPSIPVDLLDDDDGLRADVLVRASAKLRLTRDLSLSGQVSRWAVGNDQVTTFTPTPDLPSVRSDRALYFSGDDVELDRLTADYLFKATPSIYGRVSAGYFERMFAGISGEMLWKPTASPLAVGAEVNWARKRAFDSTFGLDDHDTVTGHASLYWETGYKGLEAQLDVGRYLAGDWGVTLTMSRRFANGWDVSAFVTRTEVSPAQYGDGAFTKGVRITLPLRWGLPFESKSRASLDLIRDVGDGGARLSVPDRLHGKLRDYDRASLYRNWGSYWQ